MQIRNEHFFSVFSSVATITRTDRHGMGEWRRLTDTPQLDQPAALRRCSVEPGGES